MITFHNVLRRHGMYGCPLSLFATNSLQSGLHNSLVEKAPGIRPEPGVGTPI